MPPGVSDGVHPFWHLHWYGLLVFCRNNYANWNLTINESFLGNFSKIIMFCPLESSVSQFPETFHSVKLQTFNNCIVCRWWLKLCLHVHVSMSVSLSVPARGVYVCLQSYVWKDIEVRRAVGCMHSSSVYTAESDEPSIHQHELIKRAYWGLLELEEDEEEVLLAAAVFATSKRRRQHRHWVQPINQKRPQYMVHTLIFMASFSWPCCSAYARKSGQEPCASGESPCMCPWDAVSQTEWQHGAIHFHGHGHAQMGTPHVYDWRSKNFHRCGHGHGHRHVHM